MLTQPNTAAPAPQLRHRRVYLSLALGLSPVQRGLLDAYVATLLSLVAKSAKTVAAPVSPVNPEAEQLERRTCPLMPRLAPV